MRQSYIAMLHPLIGDTFRRPTFTGHTAQVVVHTYFVVEVIEACSKVRIVFLRVITLADNNEFRVTLLKLGDGPFEELHGYHLCHVHTHSVNTLPRPEKQDIQHLRP